MFIDETGANTAMTRTHGYAPRGERVPAAVPHGHWETVTFVAGLTTAGMTAPIAFDEPMTGAVFVAYVEQVLVPTLRPGMVVIPDNLPAHHVSGVREAIEGAGCRVEYLPPYSPDRNPIENAFSKFKRLLRTAAARTVDGVYQAMSEALKSFAPDECLNDIRHAGYGAATAK